MARTKQTARATKPGASKANYRKATTQPKARRPSKAVGELLFPTEAAVATGLVEYPKVGRNTVYDRKYYHSGKVYILDEPHRAIRAAEAAAAKAAKEAAAAIKAAEDAAAQATVAETTGASESETSGTATEDDNESDAQASSARSRSSTPAVRTYTTNQIHPQKCANVRAFFEEHTPYKIEPVPELRNEHAWIDFWEAQMKSWTDDQLIVIYFHGGAGHNGPDYTWKFKKRPLRINAYDFIESLCKGPADVKMVLECYLAPRFKERCHLISQAKKHNRNVEIVGTGQPGQDEDGIIEANGFTDVMLNRLKELIDNTWTGPKYFPRASVSIPELMARSKELPSNPYRIWTSRYKEPKENEPPAQLWRIKMNAYRVGKAGKLVFHKDCTRDSAKERALLQAKVRMTRKHFVGAAINHGPDGDDEGFEEEVDEDSAEAAEAADAADAADAGEEMFI